jgi:hypothetical protein
LVLVAIVALVAWIVLGKRNKKNNDNSTCPPASAGYQTAGSYPASGLPPPMAMPVSPTTGGPAVALASPPTSTSGPHDQYTQEQYTDASQLPLPSASDRLAFSPAARSVVYEP